MDDPANGQSSASSSNPNRLPRLTTDSSRISNGPHSAPVLPPIRMPELRNDRAPPRSASSPDPRIPEPRQTGQPRSSPAHSPIDPHPSSSLNDPFASTPRRPSPTTQNPNLTLAMPVPHPVRPRGSSTGDTPGSSSQRENSGDATPKPGKLDGPTACGQCGQGVRGQFVRAMGKVYHLQCFRCKVGHIL